MRISSLANGSWKKIAFPKNVIVSDYYSFFKYVSYDFAGAFKRFYFLFYQVNNQIGSWFFLYSWPLQQTITCSKSTVGNGLKYNNEDTGTTLYRNLFSNRVILSAWVLQLQEALAWRRSGVFIVNYEHILHIFVLFLSLTLNRVMFAGLLNKQVQKSPIRALEQLVIQKQPFSDVL